MRVKGRQQRVLMGGKTKAGVDAIGAWGQTSTVGWVAHTSWCFSSTRRGVHACGRINLSSWGSSSIMTLKIIVPFSRFCLVFFLSFGTITKLGLFGMTYRQKKIRINICNIPWLLYHLTINLFATMFLTFCQNDCPNAAISYVPPFSRIFAKFLHVCIYLRWWVHTKNNLVKKKTMLWFFFHLFFFFAFF